MAKNTNIFRFYFCNGKTIYTTMQMIFYNAKLTCSFRVAIQRWPIPSLNTTALYLSSATANVYRFQLKKYHLDGNSTWRTRIYINPMPGSVKSRLNLSVAFLDSSVVRWRIKNLIHIRGSFRFMRVSHSLSYGFKILKCLEPVANILTSNKLKHDGHSTRYRWEPLLRWKCPTRNENVATADCRVIYLRP